MSVWQSISTAPTGGIIDDSEWEEYERGPYLLLTDGEKIAIGHFESDCWYIAEGGFFNPTHWSHLPDLPEA